MKIAVLVSGGGTNLGAIIEAVNNGKIKSAEIACVVANKPGVGAIDRAEKAGIPYRVITKKEYGDNFCGEIADYIASMGAEMVVLAGFLAIVDERIYDRFPTINVHPSLIPSFCGEGYYGLAVHEAALSYGVKVTGATVHFVNHEVDGGAIIMQKAVAIQDGDTPEVLQKRVMAEAEHIILPEAIELFASGKIAVDGRITKINK